MRIGALNGKRLWRWRRIGGELGFIFRCVRAGQTALDIGANVGLLTLPLARQVGPGGRVVAFEPGPKSYELLTRNIAANGYGNVRAENAAVSYQSGTVNLYISGPAKAIIELKECGSTSASETRFQFRALRLTTISRNTDVQSVDFIKMDVQGAEMFALHGMRETLSRNASIQVILEFTPEAIAFTGSSAAEMLRLCKRAWLQSLHPWRA